MAMVDFQYVDNLDSMRKMIRHLDRCPRISVDLESDSFHHYAERIALLQVGDGDQVFIIDPLSVDLTSLSNLLGDASKEKVFHDADYDGRMILTFMGVKPAPVFDTMIAARILGKERVGLADLLAEYFGISMDKGLQKADWSRRPLGKEMLEYAALDVTYLPPLRDRLEMEMEKLGRLVWAHEEFERLVQGLSPMPDRKPSFVKVKGARELTPRQLAVLQELLEWREEKARRMDLPPFKVVGTERLLKLAEKAPCNRRELERCGILSPRQVSRFGAEMLEAINRGRKEPRSRWPRFPVPVRQPRDLEAERILHRLKRVRDRKAEELGLDPGFLLPNTSLKGLARLKPRTLEEIRESGLLKNWQLEAVGEALAECLSV